MLPMASWGAGTRRLAALEVAAAHHAEHPIMIVDEIERGLESYRQRILVEELLASPSQVFVTTHSAAAVHAAATATLWYVSDATVAEALRSAARLVVVEAPGGCGKTYQGASYACDIATALGDGRLLILTHTNAACDVFAGRTRGLSRVEIRTIDGLIIEIAGAYRHPLGLPEDIGAWARRTPYPATPTIFRTPRRLAPGYMSRSVERPAR